LAFTVPRTMLLPILQRDVNVVVGKIIFVRMCF